MSLDEQQRASKRAADHRDKAEELAAWSIVQATLAEQAAAGMAAVVHLLLAIEDRLNYGSQSILDGTISCRLCRAILLESNAEGHAKWHADNSYYVK